MVKEIYFFTEMGYTAYSQDHAGRCEYNNLTFPNEHFSAERARELYTMYFDELVYDAAIRGIDLMTREVIPAVKAYRPARREKVKVAG